MAGRFGLQPRRLAAASPAWPKWPRVTRGVGPAGERLRDFGHIPFASGPPIPGKTRVFRRSLRRTSANRTSRRCRWHGREVPRRSSISGDRPLRPGCPPRGSGRGPSTSPWAGTIAVQQTMEIACGIGQMDRDDAVLGLAGRPHHWRCTPGVLSPCLRSLVSSKMPMVFGRVVATTTRWSWLRARSSFHRCRQELLQVSRRDVRRQGDRLAALLPQVDHWPSTYVEKCSPRLPSRKTVVEPLQVASDPVSICESARRPYQGLPGKRTPIDSPIFASSCNINLAQ